MNLNRRRETAKWELNSLVNMISTEENNLECPRLFQDESPPSGAKLSEIVAYTHNGLLEKLKADLEAESTSPGNPEDAALFDLI